MKQLVTQEAVGRSRGVEQLVKGMQTSDGAGVNLTRVVAQPLQVRLDPFLMLDAFASDNPDDYIAGFPDHPHRGFETVTYMLAGRMRHRDSAGHEGLLQTGGVQWMIAGEGVIHSEIPEQDDGAMEGFQLWLNLPARSKMIPAWYRDIPGEQIPEYATADGAQVRVIAGVSNGVAGAMQREVTEPLYVDIHLPAGGHFDCRIPETHNAFAYVYRGAAEIEGRKIDAGRMGVLTNTAGADGVRIAATDATRLILIAGKPLREPIVQYGPFVMNSQEEIIQAITDYREGRFAQAA